MWRVDNKGSRMSMSWKALTSGKLYEENEAKIYRSQTTQNEKEGVPQVSEVYP